MPSKMSLAEELMRELNVRFWPNPAVQSSLAGRQVKNPAVASTGRFRPKAASGNYARIFPRELAVLARNIRLHCRNFNKATADMTFRFPLSDTRHVL